MMKNIFYILIAAFSLILHAKCVAQNNIVYGAGISYTNGVPTFVPPSKSARVAIDTVTSKWYEYATPGGWRWSGDRVQDISGCASPAYTPGKGQSSLVINDCTKAQNGHGPELYKYTGSAWLCLNCGGNYTAGDGIDITGTEITNTAPDQVVSITGAGINAVTGTYPNFTVTGTEVDGSTTNELQTLSVAGSNLSISGGNTVTIPTPSSTLDALTDVTITSPANNQILQYNTAGSQWVNATLAVLAAGSNTHVQYNNAGSFAGSSNFTWDNSNSKLSVNGQLYTTRVIGYNTTLTDGAIVYGNAIGHTAAIGITTDGNTRWKYGNGILFIKQGGGEFHLGRYGAASWQCFNTNMQFYTTNDICRMVMSNTNGSFSIGKGTTVADNSAILEVASTTQAFLFPRMTATQRDAIASAANGLFLYNNTANRQNTYANSQWETVISGVQYTPTGSADSAGVVGSFSWDNSYMYFKTATGWKRTALSIF